MNKKKNFHPTKKKEIALKTNILESHVTSIS